MLDEFRFSRRPFVEKQKDCRIWDGDVEFLSASSPTIVAITASSSPVIAFFRLVFLNLDCVFLLCDICDLLL